MSTLNRRDLLAGLTASGALAPTLLSATLAACGGDGDAGKPYGGDAPADSGLGGEGADGTATDSGGGNGGTGDSGAGDSGAGDSGAAPTEHCEGLDEALPEACPAPTSADGEGPNYRAGAPLRADLNGKGVEGLTLWVSGRVFTPDCAPVIGAELDLWQAGPDGKYDNETEDFDWRGRVVTDSTGGYCFSTIMPPAILNNPETLHYNVPHIHVKVRLDGEELLCTQLAFPGEADIGEGTLEDKPDDRELTVEHLNAETARVTFNIILGAPPLEVPVAP